MVRFLVGTQVQIAAGRMPIAELKQLLNEPTALKARHSAPPDGLYLMKVRFMDRLEE